MENLDDSEKNAKITDSAYSNSCSNSQSRRSSKSTHSGSHSSGSSGYGGNPSTGSSNTFSQPSAKRFKESKKKKQPQTETVTLEAPKEVEASPELPQETKVEVKPNDVSDDVTKSPVSAMSPKEHISENMDISVIEQSNVPEEFIQAAIPATSTQIVPYKVMPNVCNDGFSCVISMHDGLVMYVTSSVTKSVGFPKEMWIGRSFIDFVYPKDRGTFASQITNGLLAPTSCDPMNSSSVVFCRLRQYRSLVNSGFGVKEKKVVYLPFQLNISFKNINNEEEKVIYLVIQAKPMFSFYKTSNEVFTDPAPFVTRHISNGSLEYLDYKSIPFLGYLPQEVLNKCILQLYHPDDLVYIKEIHKKIVKEGKSQRSQTYRMLVQNGDYIKLQTEWSSFINPWSKKLEFIIGKHYIMQGPANPDVFMQPKTGDKPNNCEDKNANNKVIKEDIIRIMNEVLTTPAQTAKQHMSKRCDDLASYIESLMEQGPKLDDELRIDIQEHDERDSVILGGISPHHDNDSKSGTETPLSYNQLNYNENLQRYFERHEPLLFNYFSSESPDQEHIMSLGRRLSPMAAISGDSGDGSSSGSRPNLSHDGSVENCKILSNRCAKLTENLLNKHNSDMEKELVKKHKEARTSTKTEREKASNETKLKKKEHLARCNVAYEPARHKKNENLQTHGVKRTCPELEEDNDQDKKGMISEQSRQNMTSNNKKKCNSPSAAVSTWTTPPPPGDNTFAYPISTMNQPVPLVNPVAAIAVPYIMYPQPVFNSQFVYSPLNSQVAFPMAGQLALNAPMSQYPMTERPFVLSDSSYEQIFEPGPSFLKYENITHNLRLRREKKQADKNNATCMIANQSSSNSSSMNANSDNTKVKEKSNCEETVDRMECESSYSSFYSSFFKTESGSLTGSNDRKNKIDPFTKPQSIDQTSTTYGENKASTLNKQHCPNKNKIFPKRKTNPPWLDQVNVTPELIYKYQLPMKDVNDVLQSDMKKMQAVEQPRLVDEQLGQLYLDLQLEGVAAKLTLEEGITSSGSSVDGASTASCKKNHKSTYSRLVMVYEEDAPLPPPESEGTALLPSPKPKEDDPVLQPKSEGDTSLSPPTPKKDATVPSPSSSHEPQTDAPLPSSNPEESTSLTPHIPEEGASLSPLEPE